MGGHEWWRTRDLAETLSFAMGAAHEELEMLKVWQEQALPVLQPLVDAMQQLDEDGE